MPAALHALIQILEREISIHYELLRLADAKRDRLVAVQMLELEQVMRDEEKTIARLQQAEQERQRIVRRLQQTAFPKVTGVLKLDLIIKHADAPEQARLQELRRRLREQTCALAHKNELNKSLCQQGLASVTHTLDLLTSSLADHSPSYDMHARHGERKRIHLVDHTA